MDATVSQPPSCPRAGNPCNLVNSVNKWQRVGRGIIQENNRIYRNLLGARRAAVS